MEPTETPAAVQEPHMPAKIMQARILICASPPVICPTSLDEKSTILRVIPPLFISSPANMNRGIAINAKESTVTNIRCGIRMAGIFGVSRMYTMAASPVAKLIGNPLIKSTKKRIPIMIAAFIPPPSPPRFLP